VGWQEPIKARFFFFFLNNNAHHKFTMNTVESEKNEKENS
jgi:hypothetical protein